MSEWVSEPNLICLDKRAATTTINKNYLTAE